MTSMLTGFRNARGKHAWLVATALATVIPFAAIEARAADAPQSDPAPAPAPQDEPEATPANESGEIIVTGSRAAVNGFQAPSAVSVVGADIIARQSPSNIAEVLFQEPAFRATRSPGGNANNFSSPGQSTADLRGLGGQRTLVLVDGSRIVPQAPAVTTGVPVTTDLNVIPTNMIERVEVVTGGASAQYGSDAVAGVVNLILRKKMDGIQIEGQSGISGQGDNFRYQFGAVGGTSFADDRGNLVIAGEMASSAEIDDLYERDWGAEEWMIVANSGTPGNGLPARVVGPNVKNFNSVGGRITTPNFLYTGYTFNDNGTIRPLNTGTLNDGTYQLGGEGLSRNTGSSLVPGVKRYVGYARLSFDVSDALTFIAEGGYAQTDAHFEGGFPNTTSAGLTIRRDNAFLPAAVRAAMVSANLQTITVARGFYDIGNIRFRVRNKTPHGTIGVEGKLGGSWSYDAHYSYGQNKFRSEFDNNFTSLTGPFYSSAIDAVYADPTTNAIYTFPGGAPPPANYRLTCRALVPGSTTYNPTLAAGCVPLSVFGPNSAINSPAGAIDYVNRSGFNAVLYKQHSAAVNLRGEPFSTWAGPVSIALGGEWRKETEKLTADPLATAGRFAIGNATPFSGKFSVKEAYFEAIVPLARDLPFARSLDLNGAVRYADYSTAGGQTNWKVGGVWEPIDGLRFRVNRSRDIRAPAIYELYSPGSNILTQLTVRAPFMTSTFNGFIPQNRTIGNLDLKPEVANTLTVGAVVQPSGIPGLRASIDYYRIDLSGAIDSLSAATIGNLCTAGDLTFCNLITFNASNVPQSLTASFRNLGSFVTSGLDMVLSYRLPLGNDIALTTRFSGNYAFHAYVNAGTPNAATIDRAGENGQGNLGQTPRFRGNLSETLDIGKVSLTAQFLYISKGTNDNTFVEGLTAPPGVITINDNHVGAVIYTNLYSTVRVSDQFELNASVNNLFDRDPPVLPYATQGQAVNGQLYDKIGRSFEIGAKLRF